MTRVLVIDDDPVALEVLELMLRDAGCRMLGALTGRDGLYLARSFHPEVTLIDLVLPDISGIDVLRALLDESHPPACVMVTGLASCSSAVDAMRLGAFDYLEKPVFEEELLCTVRRAVTAHEATAPEAVSRPIERHALARWAQVVVRFANCAQDAGTMQAFGHEVGVSAGTFRNWCRTANLAPRSSMLFARALRAIVRQSPAHAGGGTLLRIADRRTLKKFVAASGGFEDRLPKTVDEFLARQQLIGSPVALAAVARALDGDASNDAGAISEVLP
jgi:DNA-binding response OmpR family regulator